ncbi:MAG: hypothetical protein AB7U46_10630 [Paenirhodobacter sp.]|uniref:hypothetical protein n=1 Tax=Paenirhodobacter sp. TaxID=1965326 RepID=UPI003D0DE564
MKPVADRMIVHVGMHKTGTSTLQGSLAAHLADPAFRYLAFEQANNSTTIRHVFWNDGLQDADAQLRIKAERQRRRGFVAMTRALNALGPEVPILSAEVIWSLPRASSDQFFDLLRIYRRNIQIVAYLRNLPDYVDSAFQERLKTRRVDLGTPTVDVPYKRAFAPLERRFGRRNLLLKLFSPPALHKGCVVQDFCKTLGIAFDPAGVTRSNERLSLPAVRLLYTYRRVHGTPRRGDRQLCTRLASLPGARFQLSPPITAAMAICDDDDFAFAQERLGVDLRARESAPVERQIASEADLLAQPEEIDWLAAATGCAQATLHSGPEAVAAAMDLLRQRALAEAPGARSED